MPSWPISTTRRGKRGPSSHVVTSSHSGWYSQRLIGTRPKNSRPFRRTVGGRGSLMRKPARRICMDDTAENRWILLDLDDTLVDTRDSCYRASSAAARELGLPVLTERAFHDVYGRLEFPECVAAWFGDGHFNEFNQAYLRKVRYIPVGDIRGLLARVRRTRLRVGVVTNSSPDEVNRKLHDIDIPLGLLDFVVTPVDLQIPKPDSRA